jgi:5-dehydro-2-deoxygluconokinase
MDYRPYSWRSAEEARGVYREAIDLTDMLVGNDEEFGMVAGEHGQGSALAGELAQRTGAVVVYKMGERGSVTHADGATIETGIFAVEARKPFGAGDAFMGGLVASLAGGHLLPDALLRGAAAAALVVSREGCASAMPDAVDLASFMATRTPTAINSEV